MYKLLSDDHSDQLQVMVFRDRGHAIEYLNNELDDFDEEEFEESDDFWSDGGTSYRRFDENAFGEEMDLR